MNNKSSFSRVAKPRVKIPLLVFMSKIKNDLSLKKSNILFLILLKNCNNLVYSIASAFKTETQLFSSRFASNLMLSAYILGMFLAVFY